jgi:MFS family permease
MWSLYGIRALVGAAEAGFFPGILLYLTYWFPCTWRARANALFIMGQGSRGGSHYREEGTCDRSDPI